MRHTTALNATKRKEEVLERRERQRSKKGFVVCLFFFKFSVRGTLKGEGKIWGRGLEMSRIGVNAVTFQRINIEIMLKNKNNLMKFAGEWVQHKE